MRLSADIAAQPLAEALAAFARQTGLHVVYVFEVVRDKKSNAVPAGLSAGEALARLLQGTGLKFEFLTAHSVRILAAPGLAHTAPAEHEVGAATLTEVLLTGSRLPQAPNDISISPITSVTADDIQKTGLTRVEDVLDTLPMAFPSLNSTNLTGADGTATVNLRGLGTQRTLVLVDGVRLGPGSADGRNWSDVSQIPVALIKRIDVLTGGASAVYGADAVAGVVNFILNTHFEGIKVDASYHFYQHTNDNQDGIAPLVSAAGDPLPPSHVNTGSGESASILLGSNFADGKGNATGYVTYDNQAGTLWTRFDYSACPLDLPAPPLVCGGARSSRGGEFQVSNNSGALLVDETVDPKSGVFRPFVTPQDFYNFAAQTYFLLPSERWTAGAFLNYEFNPHAAVYTDVMYMRNSITGQLAPSGFFGNSQFIPCADPLLTAQELATLCTPSNLAANGSNYERYNGKNYPGLVTSIFRRNVEGGNRIYNNVNDAVRAVLGVKGGFGDDWTYNVYAQHGSVHINDDFENNLSFPNVAEALNVLPGPNGPICGGQDKTGTVFVPDTKCVPWNIWVPNAVTPASLAFMSIPLSTLGSVTEQVVSGSVTGDLAKYGARVPLAEGGLQVNFGAEWRKERSSFVPNYALQDGLSTDSTVEYPVSGEFTVRELFSEMRLPLATHQRLADDLSVDVGYRYSRYSSGFDTHTYKLGLQWAPVPDGSLRGSYQRAVRAPNIGELYSLQSLGGEPIIDPCEGTPSASLAACELTGVKPEQYGHIVPNPFFPTYNAVTGGNPALQPEVANTYTVGVLLQPHLVQNLTLSLDYFNIKINGAIGAIGANTIMLDCLASVGNPGQAARFCPLIHRDPQGSLAPESGSGYITDILVNQGALATRGIDVNGSYHVPLPKAGSLSFALVGTYLKTLQTEPVAGVSSYDCAGLFGATCGVMAPKWRHVANATWSTPQHSFAATLRWRYIGPTESEQTSANPILSGNPYLPLAHIPAYSYFDLTGIIKIGKSVSLQLGVNNIADKAPPLVITNDCGLVLGATATLTQDCTTHWGDTCLRKYRHNSESRRNYLFS